jgi:D-sedoheptulose 7-phosphate isomerase
MTPVINSLQEAGNLISAVLLDNSLISKVEDAIELLTAVFKNNKKIVICGNGGSACDAMHFAEEFTGRFNKNRRALPVISLTDPGHLTCVSNDFGFKFVFQRGVEAYGQKGDLFIGLTTSGNSENIKLALDEAKNKCMNTMVLLGKSGGILAGLSDLEIIVPGKTTDRIQELHMLLLHIIIENVEKCLFPDLYIN